MTSPDTTPARRRSGTIAAFLSFLFPGLGQGFLGRREAALIFALPVAAVALIVTLQFADGPTLAVLQLLDPTVARLALVVVVLLGVWRAVAVVHAWRAGLHTPAGRVVLPLLIVAIALTHGAGALQAWGFMEAGERIFDENARLGLDPGPILVAPTADPNAPTPDPNAPTASPSPFPTDSGELPIDEVPDDPDPSIAPAPPPNIDPGGLDGADDGVLNVLVSGVDWTTGRTHALTDTMIVVSANSESGDVLMFSFPRDIAYFPLYDGGIFTGRLNTFANYAERHPERYPAGGMHSLSRQIGFLLGVPIDHYAAVNLPGFETVLETVGAVTVYNRTAINDHFHDFHLSVGEHRLNAEEAMMYVRSRYGPGNNDFVRARRQQEILAALRREILRPDRIGDLPRTIDAMSRVVNTNFPPSQVSELVRLAERVGAEPDGSWVFSSPRWAVHPPLAETGGRWVIRLEIGLIRDLSRQLFGSKSLFSR